uniref:Peptidase S1 domain-containing protein n=1 Tax=Anopheles culicifacies TaxID=139723 RepID=A0A182M4Q9_9DIPT
MMRKDALYLNDTEYLEKLRCGTRPNGMALVCCPQVTNEPQCGPSAYGTRILGGNDTEIVEFPWLALLRFQTRKHYIVANCAGSLISKRFVLTAAHCHTGAKKQGMVIHSVRLAEWNFLNYRSRRDCKQLTGYDVPICRKDYEVARVVLHPQYRVRYRVELNDIALIELVTDVEYSVFVAPICLPVDVTHLPSEDTVTEYTAAGWGSTEQGSGMSGYLKQINILEFDLQRCRKLYEGPHKDGIGVQHICAGGVRGEDTCHGDSGGPLMESVAGVWYLAGITSFGWLQCGKEGKPGVYTNVSHYLGWIAQEMYRGILV